MTKDQMDRAVENLVPFQQRRMAQLVLGGWTFKRERPAAVYWIAVPPPSSLSSRFVCPSDTLPTVIHKAWVSWLNNEEI